MPSTTIRPNANDPNMGWQAAAITGAATVWQALSDSSDSSYIRRSSGNGSTPISCSNLGTFSIPSDNDVSVVRPWVRHKQGGTGAGSLIAKLGRVIHLYSMEPPYSWYEWVSAVDFNGGAPGGTITTASMALAQSWQMSYGENTLAEQQSVIDALSIGIHDTRAYTDALRHYVYETGADVYYAARPSVSSTTTPASPITDRTKPTFNITVSATVESWQDNSGGGTSSKCEVEVAVFTDAVYGGGGFDPATSSAAWRYLYTTAEMAVGSPATAVDSILCGEFLALSDTYRVYHRARRQFTAGNWGAWSYTQFTQNVSAPANPNPYSATADQSGDYVTISATQAAGGSYTDPRLYVQRSSDGGSTWDYVLGGEGLAMTYGTAASVIDYTAPRGVSCSYRLWVVQALSGQDIAGNTMTPSAVQIDGIGWNLKVPAVPGMNAIGAGVIQDPDYAIAEDLGVFRPKGRQYPVVIAGALGGYDGTLMLSVRSTDWAKISALIDYQEPIYLESPFGWGRWIRIVGRSVAEIGAAAAPVRRVKLDFLEVAEP